MTPSHLNLLPFTGSSPFQLSARSMPINDQLVFSFFCAKQRNDLSSEIILPLDERKLGIWENDCFELFLFHRTKPYYFEFNFGFDGSWNAFLFSQYRSDLTEFAGMQACKGALKHGQSGSTCTVYLTSDVFESDLCANPVTARNEYIWAPRAITFDQGKPTYWATAHEKDKPDFHKAIGTHSLPRISP